MQQEKLQEALGYTFRNTQLLREALTHPSSGNRGNDNQRMEFLGDAVLQYLVSDVLYHRSPDSREGVLTHQRQLLVCEACLSAVARSLGVGEALRMDHGEELTGGREKPSVLCDAMEAILAAVYLDGGMEAARDVVARCWPAPEDVHRPMQDSKGTLQELLQRDGGAAPTYAIVHQEGPDHAPMFTARVSLGDNVLGEGSGRTKKHAEQAAALQALEKLRQAGHTVGFE